MPQRSFFNVLSGDLCATHDFYVDLFGYRVTFDSEWFVHLGDPEAEALEVGTLTVDVSSACEADPDWLATLSS